MTAAQTPTTARIQALALTFPALRNAPGVVPGEPSALDEWASDPRRSDGTVCEARFVLAAWDNDRSGRCGRFDVVDVTAAWDREHRAAFRAWAEEAWRP